MIELLSYLKDQRDDYDLLVVVNYDYIEYPAFQKLNIPYTVLAKNPSHKDPKLFFQFYNICKEFRPDIIHAWGSMQAFYSIPAAFVKRIPLVNSQTTNVPPIIHKFSFSNLINQINFLFSTLILANSWAGIQAYNSPAKKSYVIYNGINPVRFISLPSKESIKGKYGINTPYTVIMVASFTQNKDYDRFYKIAEYITSIRNDITFIGAGGPGKDDSEYRRIKNLAKKKPKILFPGRIDDVEALVNVCDIGILFSPHGEGISNSILEYMALSKPVIANDAGGTKELVRHNENGYVVTNESVEEIAAMITELIDNQGQRMAFGERGKEIIDESFSLEKMGQAFEDVYQRL